MQRIDLVKQKAQKYKELYLNLRVESIQAKDKWFIAQKELDRMEAEFICACCHTAIKEGEPYMIMSDGRDVVCSGDCKSGLNAREIDGILQFEAKR